MGTGSVIEVEELIDDHIITDHQWYPLVAEEVTAVKEAFAATNIHASGRVKLRQYLDIVSHKPCEIVLSESVETPDNSILATNYSIIADQPATSFQGKLYPYQEEGVAWLRSVLSEDIGAILGDEMGLGKTVQVIVVLLDQAACDKRPSLVLAPATLLENWRREFVKFAPSLTVEVHQGAERTGFPSRLSEYQVVITSYDTLVRDSAMIDMIGWNLVILDEAQAIKNPDTQRAIYIKQIPRRAAIAVTGTPVENRLRDLWSIMDFAFPNFLGDLSAFESRYSEGMDGAEALEPVISPLLLRRLVADVATDLPDRIDIPQPVSLSSASAKQYEDLRRTIIDEYGKSANLVSLIKLRMFCTHPFLIEHTHTDPAQASTKYDRLLEILEEIVLAGHKALIFTSFKVMTDILTHDLPARFPIHCDWIDGRVEVADRQEKIDRFQQAHIPSVLILNPRAAGTGLNITAANHVIHYNLEWNPAVEDQATARAYRRGQERPVTVHRLFHPGTVEEVIDDRVNSKRRVADAAVVGTTGEDHDISRALAMSPVLVGS